MSASETSSTHLPPRTPPKKKSLRDLNSTTPLGGRSKASGSTARAAAVSLQPPTRSSPGRGLTLRIEDNMTEFSKAKAVQSAPVRPIRRLPAIPPPPIPASTVDEAPSSMLVTPVLNTDAPPRAKRALPRLPIVATEPPRAISDAISGATVSASAVERRRPLPIPIPLTRKAESHPQSDSSPPITVSRSLPASSTVTNPPATKIPSPSLIATFPHPDILFSPKKKKHQHSGSEKIPGKKTADRKLRSSRSNIDLNLDVVQLHRQYVVDRSPVCISLDCDTASEDEYSEETRSTAVFIRDAPAVGQRLKEVRKSGINAHDHADYAWLLTNRILHHQKSSEGHITCKWMREKRGKRYTEEDFSNIIDALRQL
ncbi:hypothetical protein BDN70DRAFT_884399 [Pholiota conissans]|uniref:Uncharacterized protein n=1 Tax=Pholiota conissans TaxID=109636 RepID=A0A9P5YUG7_9AGAR|nr:hypothetical protein BDN70DRAFT_884399 [Pholiota conissans]